MKYKAFIFMKKSITGYGKLSQEEKTTLDVLCLKGLKLGIGYSSENAILRPIN